MLVRLEKWSRFEKFCRYTIIHQKDLDDEWSGFIMLDAVLTWLAADAKDGKAPALFNALCEFLGMEDYFLEPYEGEDREQALKDYVWEKFLWKGDEDD